MIRESAKLLIPFVHTVLRLHTYLGRKSMSSYG